MDESNRVLFTEIATGAILESMSSSDAYEPGECTKKAIFHADDQGFKEIVNAVARGMGLRVVGINNVVGIILMADDEQGLFVPGLTWLSAKLGAKNNENRDEARCIVLMVLLALIAEAFPTAKSMEDGWDSAAQFTEGDVLEKLHKITEEVVESTGNRVNGNDCSKLAVAILVNQNRIPKYPQGEIIKTSVLRSQMDMVKGWIKLLEEQGLLVSDQGYQEDDIRWMATQKFKTYMGHAGAIALIDRVLALNGGIDSGTSKKV